MTHQVIGTPAPEWLRPDGRARLEHSLDAALRSARTLGAPVLTSVSLATDSAVDPTAVIAASRRPGEPWFCFEQPEHEQSAIAALGSVRALEAQGAGRFEQLSRSWQGLVARAMSAEMAGPPGTGLIAVGGFAFAPEGGTAPSWDAFAPASLVVPEVSLARRGGEATLTINVDVAPDDTPSGLMVRVEERLHSLRRAGLPLLDPAPTGSYGVRSAMPPTHYEEAVARAVQRIQAGELQKVVLAREVEVQAPVDHDPGGGAGGPA